MQRAPQALMGWKAIPVVALSVVLLAAVPRGAARHRTRSTAMVATAFCQKGQTRSGVPARRGIIAADPRLLPLGSTVRVHGLGAVSERYLVADTGAKVKGRHIDIFMPSCRAAKRFGRRTVFVEPVAP